MAKKNRNEPTTTDLLAAAIYVQLEEADKAGKRHAMLRAMDEQTRLTIDEAVAHHEERMYGSE